MKVKSIKPNVLHLYPEVIHMPCGGTARQDYSTEFSYRCDDCGAVPGSIEQPHNCREITEKYRMWKKIGGKGWNYKTGKLEVDK